MPLTGLPQLGQSRSFHSNPRSVSHSPNSFFDFDASSGQVEVDAFAPVVLDDLFRALSAVGTVEVPDTNGTKDTFERRIRENSAERLRPLRFLFHLNVYNDWTIKKRTLREHF
ncbi:hypothetical protein RB195_012263 [Necator americanus]|uniref:Uncharacterized protein n=1 Tax=Necator americanus TaxID=51031 RepID=A0ABR1D692_NECAM